MRLGVPAPTAHHPHAIALGVHVQGRASDLAWAPGFTLDELVVWRGLREGCEPPAPHHDRAAARARDTAALLTDLIRLGVTLNQMLLMSAVITAPLSPPPLKDDETGWRLVPDDNLHWLARHAINLPVGVRTRASREKARRTARVGE